MARRSARSDREEAFKRAMASATGGDVPNSLLQVMAEAGRENRFVSGRVYHGNRHASMANRDAVLKAYCRSCQQRQSIIYQ